MDEGTECANCGHYECYHHLTPTQKTRCHWTQSGVTTTGISGMSYTTTCDCVKYEQGPPTPELIEKRRTPEDRHLAKMTAKLQAALAADPIPRSPGGGHG